MSPFDFDIFLARRLQWWPDQFVFMPDSRVLVSRAKRNLTKIGTKCAPCIRSAVLKTYAYGWLTERRFRDNEFRRCALGCPACDDPSTNDDSLEHYMCCPQVEEAWWCFAKLRNDRGPQRVLGLTEEAEEVTIARLAFLYCIYTIHANLRVRRVSVTVSTLTKVVAERRRHIEGRYKTTSHALSKLRKAR